MAVVDVVKLEMDHGKVAAWHEAQECGAGIVAARVSFPASSRGCKQGWGLVMIEVACMCISKEARKK